MKIISEIKIKVNGEPCMAQVTEDGFAILPDGTKKKLSDDQFTSILEKINKDTLANDTARPLTLPDASVEETSQSIVEEPAVEAMSPPPEDEERPSIKIETKQEIIKPKDNPIQLKAEAPVQFKKEKPKKEPTPPKEKKEKTSNSSMATSILAAGFVILIVMFMYAVMSGLISFNTGNPLTPAVPPVSDSEQNDSSSTPDQGTKEDLDRAETILIVARIVTPDGKEKEVVLGYFTTDGENSTLPDLENNGTSSDGASNSRASNSSRLTLDEGFTEGAITLANRYSPASYLDVLNELN